LEQTEGLACATRPDMTTMKARRAVGTPQPGNEDEVMAQSSHSPRHCHRNISKRVTCFDLRREIRSRLPHQLYVTPPHTHKPHHTHSHSLSVYAASLLTVTQTVITSLTNCPYSLNSYSKSCKHSSGFLILFSYRRSYIIKIHRS